MTKSTGNTNFNSVKHTILNQGIFVQLRDEPYVKNQIL